MSHKNSIPLLNKVAEFDNLVRAFHECSRFKRSSRGYQEALFGIGEKLKLIENELKSGTFKWKGYRSFYVHDPKKRLIMCAPFMDRVVHHAIHRLVEPTIDPLMSDSVFACRKKRGNRRAAVALWKVLEKFGPNRFTMKLDVSNYFQSINHNILLNQFLSCLPDPSIDDLLFNLLKSQPEFSKLGTGIPIGNLTSQLFANFYLITADRLATKALGLDYYWQQKKIEITDVFYIRYMDDLVLVGKNKRAVLDAVESLVYHIEQELKLSMAINKRVPLGNAPVPFLGYLLNHDGYKILSRNKNRFKKKVKRLKTKKVRPSYMAMVEGSYQAWQDLERGRDSRFV